MKSWQGAVGWLSVALLVLQGCAGSPDHDGGLGGAEPSLLVKTGLAQLGKPYVYGAEAPSDGFDCSGLTYYVHQRAGVAIPRTAVAQLQAARSISKRRLRAGDMVFFKTGRRSYHVGLMVDPERFVHVSTSKRRVMVSRLDNPYWQAHFLGAGTFAR